MSLVRKVSVASPVLTHPTSLKKYPTISIGANDVFALHEGEGEAVGEIVFDTGTSQQGNNGLSTARLHDKDGLLLCEAKAKNGQKSAKITLRLDADVSTTSIDEASTEDHKIVHIAPDKCATALVVLQSNGLLKSVNAKVHCKTTTTGPMGPAVTSAPNLLRDDVPVVVESDFASVVFTGQGSNIEQKYALTMVDFDIPVNTFYPQIGYPGEGEAPPVSSEIEYHAIVGSGNEYLASPMGQKLRLRHLGPPPEFGDPSVAPFSEAGAADFLDPANPPYGFIETVEDAEVVVENAKIRGEGSFGAGNLLKCNLNMTRALREMFVGASGAGQVRIKQMAMTSEGGTPASNFVAIVPATTPPEPGSYLPAGIPGVFLIVLQKANADGPEEFQGPSTATIADVNAAIAAWLVDKGITEVDPFAFSGGEDTTVLSDITTEEWNISVNDVEPQAVVDWNPEGASRTESGITAAVKARFRFVPGVMYGSVFAQFIRDAIVAKANETGPSNLEWNACNDPGGFVSGNAWCLLIGLTGEGSATDLTCDTGGSI